MAKNFIKVLDFKDLKQCFHETSSGDPWGNTMGWLFAIADYLHFETEIEVPEEWEFRPSPLGVGTEEDAYEWQALKEAEPEAILPFGRLLWRYRGYLKFKKKDY